MSVAGFQDQKAMSPTSWLSLNNFSKIPAIIISFFLFGGHLSFATAHGMAISIFSSYLYALAGNGKVSARVQWFSCLFTASSAMWLYPNLMLRNCPESTLCIPEVFSGRNVISVMTTGKIASLASENRVVSWNISGNCRLWGVTTTIFNPAPSIFQFLHVNNTCLVIVGDIKTNHTVWYNLTSVYQGRGFYLSPADQLKLPWSSIKLLPWNHFGRKNIGYLVVVQHGAKMVYDFDDENTLRLD